MGTIIIHYYYNNDFSVQYRAGYNRVRATTDANPMALAADSNYALLLSFKFIIKILFFIIMSWFYSNLWSYEIQFINIFILLCSFKISF